MSALSYLGMWLAPIVTGPLPSARSDTCLVSLVSSLILLTLDVGGSTTGSLASPCRAAAVALNTCSTQKTASFLSTWMVITSHRA